MPTVARLIFCLLHRCCPSAPSQPSTVPVIRAPLCLFGNNNPPSFLPSIPHSYPFLARVLSLPLSLSYICHLHSHSHNTMPGYRASHNASHTRHRRVSFSTPSPADSTETQASSSPRPTAHSAMAPSLATRPKSSRASCVSAPGSSSTVTAPSSGVTGDVSSCRRTAACVWPRDRP